MRRLLLGITVLVPLQTTAEEQTTPAPGLEMLEYLGQWQDNDDEWVDPVGLYTSGLLRGREKHPSQPNPPRNRASSRSQDPR